MATRATIAETAKAVVKMVAKVAAKGATHIVTPEMLLTGYHGKFDQTERDEALESVIRPACRKYGVTLSIGAGNFRNAAGKLMKKPYIQTVVIGPDGKIVGVHNKTIPTGGDLKWCMRGDPKDLSVRESGRLKFGNTICNDFWATPGGCTTLPDINLPVLLGKMGAKVIFHSIASGHSKGYLDFHTTRMEERAIRAGVWVVTANLVENPKLPLNAPSGIVGPDGVWRYKASLKGERFYVKTIEV